MPHKTKLARRRYLKGWNKKNHHKIRKANRDWAVRKHQITLEEFSLLLIAQKHRCALCDKKLILGLPGMGKYGCSIDHDHSCKFKRDHFNKNKGCGECIRGLLCRDCNSFVVPGLEFLRNEGLYVHNYLLCRPILLFRNPK